MRVQQQTSLNITVVHILLRWGQGMGGRQDDREDERGRKEQ